VKQLGQKRYAILKIDALHDGRNHMFQELLGHGDITIRDGKTDFRVQGSWTVFFIRRVLVHKTFHNFIDSNLIDQMMPA
jgi:hypothetical protein